jgi:hypothetical protein
MPHFPGLYARAETTLAQAQIGEARDGPAAVIGHIRQICADLPARPGLLLGDPVTAAWLARTALAAGENELAAIVARTAGTLACAHPGYPALTAAAAHSLGLAAQDPVRLAEAADQHPDPWAKASAAEDLGARQPDQDHDQDHDQDQDQDHDHDHDHDLAIHHLTEAIGGYQLTGATADAARVRRRLRKLGVRRRHWTQSSHGPVTGWESLTGTERAVSELVAQGLNNRLLPAPDIPQAQHRHPGRSRPHRPPANPANPADYLLRRCGAGPRRPALTVGKRGRLAQRIHPERND